MAYRYLGSATTNAQGVAELNFTGTGRGELDIVASTSRNITSSSLVSETYEVIDCAFYDKGTTGTPNSEWWKGCGSTTLTSDANGLTFTNNSSTWCYIAPNKIGTPKQSVTDLVEWNDFACEFIYHSATSYAFIEVRDSNSHTAQLDLLTCEDGDLIHMEYENNVLKFYKNGQKATTDKTNCNGDLMIRFSAKECILRISDFKVYPI